MDLLQHCTIMIKKNEMERYKKVFCKRTLIFMIIASVTVLSYIKYMDYGLEDTGKTILQELEYYQMTMIKQCKEKSENFGTAQNTRETNLKALDNYFVRPKCENLLQNMVKGKWVKTIPTNNKLVDKLNEKHMKYRKKVGISTMPWRNDKLCGYKVLSPKISSSWPQTGSFCDPEGSTPCCTDLNEGTCVSISDEQQCNCPQCVDTSQYMDALVAHWEPQNKGCAWTNYTSLEACAILNKLSTQQHTAELHFVGDSLMRNMFMGLETILTGEIEKGIWKKCVSNELKEICLGENKFLLRPCHDFSVAFTLEDLAHNSGIICNGQRHFQAEYHGIGMPSQADQFIKLIENLRHKQNTYVILAVGLHFHSKHDYVIKEFLQPVLKKNSENDWPKFLWVHPTSVGLLKPPAYMDTQGDIPIAKFASNMEKYLKEFNIPVLDFRHITKGVNSYDGTHYGTGVNMMKAQILLNYLADTV